MRKLQLFLKNQLKSKINGLKKNVMKEYINIICIIWMIMILN